MISSLLSSCPAWPDPFDEPTRWLSTSTIAVTAVAMYTDCAWDQPSSAIVGCLSAAVNVWFCVYEQDRCDHMSNGAGHSDDFAVTRSFECNFEFELARVTQRHVLLPTLAHPPDMASTTFAWSSMSTLESKPLEVWWTFPAGHPTFAGKAAFHTWQPNFFAQDGNLAQLRKVSKFAKFVRNVQSSSHVGRQLDGKSVCAERISFFSFESSPTQQSPLQLSTFVHLFVSTPGSAVRLLPARCLWIQTVRFASFGRLSDGIGLVCLRFARHPTGSSDRSSSHSIATRQTFAAHTATCPGDAVDVEWILFSCTWTGAVGHTVGLHCSPFLSNCSPLCSNVQRRPDSTSIFGVHPVWDGVEVNLDFQSPAFNRLPSIARFFFRSIDFIKSSQPFSTQLNASIFNWYIFVFRMIWVIKSIDRFF